MDLDLIWNANVIQPFSDDEDEKESYEKNLAKEESQKRFIGDKVKNDPDLSKHAKKQFKNQFLKLYLSDEEYRNEVKDQYILFIDQEYIGVYPSIKSMFSVGKKGSDKYCIKISGHKEYALAKHSIPMVILKDEHGKDYVSTFKTHCNVF